MPVHLAAYGDGHPTTPHQTTVTFAGTISKNDMHIDAIMDDSMLAYYGLEIFNGGKDCPPHCTYYRSC